MYFDILAEYLFYFCQESEAFLLQAVSQKHMQVLWYISLHWSSTNKYRPNINPYCLY